MDPEVIVPAKLALKRLAMYVDSRGLRSLTEATSLGAFKEPIENSHAVLRLCTTVGSLELPPDSDVYPIHVALRPDIVGVYPG